MQRRVLVTAALPYANGSIHLGHLVEAIQTDVYVRARKLQGEDCVFMWADDTHGTPIQVRARREGISPEALIARSYDEHVADYRDFDIGYDIFHTTHSEETRRHAEGIFSVMQSRGDIAVREVQQLYCPSDGMFLPDRFVMGICPNCKSPDQYGDSCEKCGKTYAPTDLAEPRCSLCGTTPVLRGSEHLFVPLARHEEFLRTWLRAPADGGTTILQDTVRNYVLTWVEDLRDWDISRDGPYFGFEIPGWPGKYFYVWFDAPVGYIGATEKWCRENGRDFEAYWRNPGGDTEIVHVIGKDIVYFHCLFWPAMLNAAGYTTPSRVHVHGWLTVNGEKMSKTRGTFILARTYLDHLDPSYLRYYFAAKLGPGQDDIDLSLDDFCKRVDAELVKKAANLASRCVKFLHGRLGATAAALPSDAAEIVARARERLAQAPGLYAEFDSKRALELAIDIAEDFNLYLTEAAPWKLAESDPDRARAVCSAGIFASQVIAAIFKPVLPAWAEKVERMLRLPAPLSFHNGGDALPVGHAIGEYETLAERIDPKKVEAIVEASRETIGGTAGASEPSAATDEASAADADAGGKGEAAPAYEVPPLAETVSLGAFSPIDLRVGRVAACEAVEGAKKLLRLTIDLGPLGTRNVFSGIAASYEPAALVGKHVVVFANLESRKMRFGISEGMVLASGESDDAVTVLELDRTRSRPGEKIS
jgi:methionyl-tRNA synthetase